MDLPVERLVEHTIAAARGLIEEAGIRRQDIVGVGVGVPGSIDDAKRTNLHSALTGWSDIAFADLFEAGLGLRVVLQHNATAIALAETWFGAGRQAGSTLHVFMGRGIGAGLAMQMRVSRSPRAGGPVEIGHVVVDPDGRPCRCGGRGCLETVFSQQPLLEVLERDTVPEEGLVAAAMNRAEWPAIYEAFLCALATTITLIAPDVIVLGGHLGEAPDAFLDALRRDLRGRGMRGRGPYLVVERTRFGPDAGVLGAACAGLERFFYDEGPPDWAASRRAMMA